jgi:hypothetical protein
MRDQRSSKPFTFQEGLEELAERIAETDRIPSLRPGELRPPGFYLVHHYWGWGGKPLPPPKPRDER